MSQHIKDKHHGNGHMIEVQVDDDAEEESMASRHIQATLDEAMGVPNFDREWLI